MPRRLRDTHGRQTRWPYKSDEISPCREQQREITTTVAGARQNISSGNHRPASISDGIPCVPDPVNWKREHTEGLDLEEIGSDLPQQRHSIARSWPWALVFGGII